MSYKKIFYFLGILLPLGAILSIFAIDPNTGYFKQGHIIFNLLFVFLFAFILFSLLPFLIKEKDGKVGLDIMLKKNEIEVILICVTALFQVLYAFSSALTSVNDIGQVDYKNVFLTLFAFISAIFYVMYALGKKDIYEKTTFKFLALIPVAFFLVRLVIVFNQLTMQANNSAYIFELIELATFVFFFMNFAKFILQGKNIRLLFICGIWSILSAFIASTSSILIPIIHNNSSRQAQPLLLETMYLFTGIFIFIVIYKIPFPKKRSE